MENPRTIIDLPFEVLDLIFKELQCLKDKVNLAQTHDRLGKAFAFHSRNEFRTLTLSTAIADESWAFLVQECGTSIEELDCERASSHWHEFIADSIVKHCLNLKSVSTEFSEDNSASIMSFLGKIKNSLLALKLMQRYSRENELSSEILKVLCEISQLKRLSLCYLYPDENVHYIQTCVALEKLKLDNYGMLERHTVNLQQICAPLKNLRELSVSNFEILPFEDSNSSIWARLETLELIQCDYPEIPYCPQLKSLNIYYTFHCFIDDYGLELILKNGRNLETLYEECDPPLDADDYFRVLRACPKLRHFHATMDYMELSPEYMSTILGILKDNGVTREDRFELVITSNYNWDCTRELLRLDPDAELIDLYKEFDKLLVLT
ncbi:uncharacterized protein LOC108108458 [Drosophila eugracilis]|uniref:uncharacterized protein LOC108108458 n=1 Tax=Drosophila eugracilis TaxID=29029 RepID=UPI0007E64540|nr:uncharacterized protein LOC108108458 [Drosophila eugracilis]